MFFKKKKAEKTPQEIVDQLARQEEEIISLRSEIEKIKKEEDFFLQKTGLVRYNPFSDIGGEQSFSLAIVDKKGNGFVVTSLYARDGNRVYAKPINNGSSEYTLSKEEERAIKLCQKN